MKAGNIFGNLPDASLEEQVEELLQSKSARIERITSKGQISPEDFWYEQEEDEFVLLLKGQAKLLFEKGEYERLLSAGDYIIIPAHCRHKISWTSTETETVWLAVFIDQ